MVDDRGSRPAHSPVKLWQPSHHLSTGRVGTVGTHQRGGLFDCSVVYLLQLRGNVLGPDLSFQKALASLHYKQTYTYNNDTTRVLTLQTEYQSRLIFLSQKVDNRCKSNDMT